MRVFIAVELPEKVKRELRALQDKLMHYHGLQASFNKEHHITIKFLSEVTPAKAEEVKNSLSNCKLGKINLAMGKTGVFPNENYITVAWIGIEPEDELIKLQKEIDEALQKDFPKEVKFKAHMTLARIKYLKDKKAFVDWLKELKPEGMKFEVSGFKLLKSTLGKEGATYEELASFE